MPASPPAAAPNAFPVQVSEAAVAAVTAAPAPRPSPAAPAIAAAPGRAGASGAVAARGEAAPVEGAAAPPQMSTQMNDRARAALISESDLAMFRAVRAGDIPGLRVAISRGANVNGKDERGRTT